MEPFIGEIRLVSWNYPPKGWAFCDGQSLPVRGNEGLYTVLGNTYGGDRSNFKLPDLRGRIATHRGPTMKQGQAGGVPFVALTKPQLAKHHHRVIANDTRAPDSGADPAPDKRLAGTQPGSLYGPSSNVAPMNDGVLVSEGGGTPHTNRQPYTTLAFAIALKGIEPHPTREA